MAQAQAEGFITKIDHGFYQQRDNSLAKSSSSKSGIAISPGTRKLGGIKNQEAKRNSSSK